MIDGKGPGRIGLVVHPTRTVDGALATLERWATQHDVGLVQLAIDGGRRPEVAPLGKLEPDDLVVALGGDGTVLTALRATATTDAPVRRLRILAVDDEPALTKAVVRLLRPIGHLVAMASSGEEALEKLATEPFDVVLSDVGMGAGMNGWELARVAGAFRADLKVLFTSGFPGAAFTPDGSVPERVHLLGKPYRKNELARKLREVLSA